MSTYRDSFADTAVPSSSFVDTIQASQDAVGTKKKIKIDASLLLNLDVTTALLTRPDTYMLDGETKAMCGQGKSRDNPPCTNGQPGCGWI